MDKLQKIAYRMARWERLLSQRTGLPVTADQVAEHMRRLVPSMSERDQEWLWQEIGRLQSQRRGQDA